MLNDINHAWKENVTYFLYMHKLKNNQKLEEGLGRGWERTNRKREGGRKEREKGDDQSIIYVYMEISQ